MAGYGFVPVQHRQGALELCAFGTDAQRVGVGDPVTLAGSSARIGAGPIRPTVVLSAASDSIYGVVVGIQQHTVATGMNLNQIYRPASTAMYAMVYVPGENDRFWVESDEDSASFAATDVGLNADMATASSCDTGTGQSTCVLDISTKATTNTLAFKIIGYDENRGPSSTSPNPRLMVTFNQRSTIDTGGTGT